MLANKIVNLEFEPLQSIQAASTYSKELIEIVSSCLVFDEKKRPDIL